MENLQTLDMLIRDAYLCENYNENDKHKFQDRHE